MLLEEKASADGTQIGGEMKRVMIFIGLKLLEIAALCGAIAIVILLVELWLMWVPVPIETILTWIGAGIWAAGVAICAFTIIYPWMKSNWDWAGRIARKQQRG